MNLREKLQKFFNCQQCGACCKREGGVVYVTMEEAEKIASLLDKPLFMFLQENCKKQRGWLVISDDKFNPNCYLNKNRCQIYSCRPKFCKQYPFVPEILKDDNTIKEEAKLCPAIFEAINYPL